MNPWCFISVRKRIKSPEISMPQGQGGMAATAIVSGDGVCLGDAKRPISVEEIRDNFDKISDMTNKREHDSGLGIFEYMGPLLG